MYVGKPFVWLHPTLRFLSALLALPGCLAYYPGLFDRSSAVLLHLAYVALGTAVLTTIFWNLVRWLPGEDPPNAGDPGGAILAELDGHPQPVKA